MKRRDSWQPSKYVRKNGKLVASRDRSEVGVGSRLVTDLVAGLYDKYLRLYAKGKLLDLGCGKAPLFIAYRDFVTDNVCVDWENTKHKNEYLDFECDLNQALPFDDGEFDTIILSDVLEHIARPEQLWNEMGRILSVNGTVILNVPFFYCLHERPYDYYRYTEFALQLFVENTGMRLVKLEPVGGTPEILADILAKHLQFIPLVGSGLSIAVQYTAGLFVKTAFGGKISRNTAQAFPLGYFLIAEKIQ